MLAPTTCARKDNRQWSAEQGHSKNVTAWVSLCQHERQTEAETTVKATCSHSAHRKNTDDQRTSMQ